VPRKRFARGKGQDWWYLQSAHGENRNQSNLLSAAKIQATNNGYGEDDDCKVCENVDCSIGAVLLLACGVSSLCECTYNHIANWLMQEAFSRVQNARTGTQAKMLLKTVQIV
jgi:hypothetical protein